MHKVKRGDPLRIPADTYNAFVDAAADYQRRRSNLGGEPSRGIRLSGILPVKNATGADLDRFSVVGIDGPLYSPADSLDSFKFQLVLSGVEPSEEDHTGRFAVLLEPVKDGQIGAGLLSGVVQVKVDVSDESHEYADVNNAETGSLASGTVGAALILWKESGTGEKWAVVRLGTGRPAGTIFPVSLTQVGGEDGTDTTQATWTYDVTDSLTGETLAEGVDPTASPHLHQRPSAGSIIPAASGLAYYKPDKTLVLAFVYEVADQGACSEGS